MTDQPDLRASHADRDGVVDVLRTAAGEGRLTAEELDTRLEAALTARTLGELAELTSDLPVTGAVAAAVRGVAGIGTPPPAKDVLVIEQRGGQYARTGAWVVPQRIEVRPKLCDVLLDFTDAVISGDTLLIDVRMRLGKLIIIGRPGIDLDVDGLTLAYASVRLRGERRDRGDRRRRHDLGSELETAPPLHIEIVGTLRHGKLIERRGSRRRSAP